MRGGGIFVLSHSVSCFLLLKGGGCGRLTSRVSEAFQVLEYPEAGLFVCHRHIHVMLLPVLVDREALKRQHSAGAELRFDGARDEDGALHFQVLDPALHQRELERDDAGHLDRAAERDLSVALTEVQISNRELGARDVHGEVGLASARQVLDVAVPAMLGSAGDGAGALSADLGFKVTRGRAGVDIFRFREIGDYAVEGVEFDELGLTAGPLGEDLGGRGTAHDSWVD